MRIPCLQWIQIHCRRADCLVEDLGSGLTFQHFVQDVEMLDLTPIPIQYFDRIGRPWPRTAGANRLGAGDAGEAEAEEGLCC